MKKKALLTICLYLTLSLFCTHLIYATTSQNSQKKITGTVTDESGLGLIGVTVMQKGTSNGSITDLDGNYTLQVSGSNAVLEFKYVGFLPQESVVGSQSVINVVLKENVTQLDELVVVGYGIQKKSHLTGSIAKVNLSGLEDIPVSRVDQALQGRIAGVQIQNTTSEVGVSPQIRVRGMGSISANSEPLIVVDGVPIPGGLEVVDMGDIESIEVLKDAASAAIYGSRAAGGVILITTKSGNVQAAKYVLKMSSGIKNAYKLHPILSSQDYVAMVLNESNLKGVTLPAQEFAFSTMTNNTNWQEQALRTAQIRNVTLNVSGGKKEVKYFISGNYFADQGIMQDNNYDKLSVRSKVDVMLSKKVSFNININPSYTQRQRPATQFLDFYRTPSWMPVRHTAETAAITGKPEGSYASGADFNNRTYTGINIQDPGSDPNNPNMRTVTTSPFNTANNNPQMILNTDRRYQKDYRLQMSTNLNIQILDGLSFNTANSTYVTYTDASQYRETNSQKDGIPNRASNQTVLSTDFLTENIFNYIGKKGKHDFSGMGGFTLQSTSFKRTGITGIGLPTDYIETVTGASDLVLPETFTRKDIDDRLVSFLGRGTYSYDDKYLLSASLRTDGSSKFGKNKQWAWFPSVSLGYRISEEPFLKDKITWLDQLKLRGSYGVTGNKDIPTGSTFNALNAVLYPFGTSTGNPYTGLANSSTRLANPFLTWEQTNEYNFGADISILKSRISLSAEYYYSITKSLLYAKPISSISGYLDEWTNLGKVRNRGFEFELNTRNIVSKDFNWSSSVNLSLNSNRLLDLGGPQSLISTGTDAGEMYLAKLGYSAVQFYGFKTIGVWKDQAEIDANPHHISDKPGGLRVQNTNDDDVINDDDMVSLGNPFPKVTWGINNTFQYRNIDLSFLLQGVQGISVYNGDARYNESRKWNAAYVTGRWISPEHPGDGKTPYFTNGINWMLTDYVIEDGSYLSLRDITVGYTLTKKMTKKIGISALRFYGSAQNLGYWWTKSYRGINPEARMQSGDYGSNPLVTGYQRGGFPIQRAFNLGIDVTF